ncbi:T9SS type A sorting domain-containing protein [Hymenobacter sp. GOD-10R]|uniref:T9SS type A sorting domain-containing protein n=1 Tax=Hymenobacter sp. GOD-10R TaxID=3093922 RepID=UPI002D7A0EAF|nr:T9SS type A sorting domain-containing protein [Hymenobacter sp. GOD-10R]WRQ30230.1 T9SS type A sorting domain-containing protein [Hymenobacter sp. GOD-10R]
MHPSDIFSVHQHAKAIRVPLAVVALVFCSFIGKAQTGVICRWDGGANTNNYLDAANWENDQVPSSIDNAVFDHSYIHGEYTVSLNTTLNRVTLNSINIDPGLGDSIRVEVPSTNTLIAIAATSTSPALSPALTIMGNGGMALAIHDKGVFTNASGASSGTAVEIAGTAATLFIYNGGTYRHYSATGHATAVENLSTIPGTENGNWVFRRGSGTLSLSNRSYPNLILRCPSNQTATNYGGSGSGILTVRGNLIIGPKATFGPTMAGEIRVAGNVVVQGAMRFVPDNSGASGTGTLTLNGQTAQAINGLAFGATTTSPNYLGPGVTLRINNTSASGVTLQAPMMVNGTLELLKGSLNTDGVNLLTLANNVQGASSTSFVNGPVARTVSIPGSVVFPVGRAAASDVAYRPVKLDITTLALPTTFTVVQQEGAFDATNLNGDLKRVSKMRSFQVTPSPIPTAGQFEGTITLSFGPDDMVTNPEASSLVIAKNSGSGWINIGRSTYTGVASNNMSVAGTLTSAPFTSFSQFTLANTEITAGRNPLPVTLTSFSATQKATRVHLRWTTATEKDNSYFDVQRSTDGHNFETIERVPGQQQSTQATVYSSFDPNIPAITGSIYYRLCQVDDDNTKTYSSVVTIQHVTGEISIYPNPTCSQLIIEVPTNEKVAYSITGAMGQIVLSGELSNSGILNVQDVPDGIYYIKLNTDGSSVTRKFIKQQ